MIDDPAPTPYKSSGCHCLQLLCKTLVSTQSEMLKRSGLADVFIDALKPNLLLLPALTPEEESLEIMMELYPALLGVVDARFVKLIAIADATWSGEKTDPGKTLAIGEEIVRYQDLLTMVYRHGAMASLSHLSPSSAGFSNTTSVPLTTFLLQQIPGVFRRMGIHTVKHFQTLLPVMRIGLMDPFILVAPEIVFAMLDVLSCVIEVGKPRIKEKWWVEILRGLVLCYLNCVDDKDFDGARKAVVNDMMARLKAVVQTLEKTVGQAEWGGVKTRLVEEEDELKDLFGD